MRPRKATFLWAVTLANGRRHTLAATELECAASTAQSLYESPPPEVIGIERKAQIDAFSPMIFGGWLLSVDAKERREVMDGLVVDAAHAEALEAPRPSAPSTGGGG